LRIERIEFEAIGPFAGYYDINLNQLGDAALFLIDGPTGAGKSTILDAITFAIYGDTSGTKGDKSRMRSQYAKPDQESWVRVTFSTPNGAFRIRRSPAFQKMKTRGEGTTKVNGTAKFQRLDGSNKWVTEFEQIEASSEAAVLAVGLTKPQFSQTVLLPQGEFDKFLKADSDDRQDLLSRIFNTSRFTKLRVALKLRAQQIDTDLADLTNSVVQRAGTIDTIFEFFEDESELLAQLAADIARVDELFAFLDDNEVAVKEHSTKTKADLNAAEADFQSANAELDLRNKELSAKNALDIANEAAKQSRETLLETVKTATELAKATKFTLTKDESWQERSNQVSAEAALLQPLLETELHLDARQLAFDEAAEVLETHRNTLKTYEALGASLPEEKKKLSAEKLKLKPLASKLAMAQLEVASLAETELAIQTLAKLTADLPDATTKAAEAKMKAADSGENRNNLVAARLANMAGELAAKLEDGQPCEVCGSLEHPNPKQISKDAVSADDIEKAEAEVKKLSEMADSAKNRLTKLQTEVATATKNLKMNPEEFQAKYDKAKNDLDVAAQADTRTQELAIEIDALDETIQANRDLKEELGKQVAKDGAELEGLKKALESDRRTLAEKARPFVSIREKRDATSALADAISAVIDAEVDANLLQGAIKEREIDLKQFKQHPEFAKTEKAQERVDLAKPRYEGLLTQDSAIDKSLKSYVPALKALKEAISERSNLLKGSEQIKSLARIADGGNPFRQPIDTFVLQSMFRQVLAAGNVRFQSLLEGRYTFELDELGSDKRSAQGLGLSVRDRNTGETRTTKSLSGGEAFCASLSLALGLSDIVRADSGGLAIDTFFIDEGFGSLDGERLNQVNNMLSRLQAEGRTIGLISHVAEMKETIQEKVDVKASKGSGPSTLSVNWAANKGRSVNN